MKNFSHIVFLSVIAIIFVAVPVLTLVGDQGSVSYYEQRNLASFPAFSSKAIGDGTYFGDINSFLSDHLCGRDNMLKANTEINLCLRKPNVNGLVVNSDVLLDFHSYLRWDLGYLAEDSANTAKKYKQLQNMIQSYGGYFCYLGVPLQSSYYANHYPDYMADRLWHTNAIRKNFGKAMSDYGIPFINMYDIYNEMGLPQNYYYATDHHFTLEGAFETYKALLENIEQETTWSFDAYEKTDFEWKSLPNPFLGSSNRKLFGLWNNSDAIQLAYPKENIPFERTNNGKPVDSTIYKLPESEDELVTYSVYMGGDIGETVITTNRPELPNILIYGDSFTNPLEALLWTQANELRSIDFRHYTECTLKDYIAEYKPDIVICVRDETTFLSEDGNGITE